MKLPITDKFLWGLYNFIDALDDAHNFISPSRSIYQTVYRDEVRLRREYEKQKAKRRFGQFVQYLERQGYIRTKPFEKTFGIMLTPKGAQKVLRIKHRIKEKKRRNDGRWLMIIFDIPEKEKRIRERLRNALVDLGYEQLQKSIWVCPYDVHKDTEEFIRFYDISSYVKLFLIGELNELSSDDA